MLSVSFIGSTSAYFQTLFRSRFVIVISLYDLLYQGMTHYIFVGQITERNIIKGSTGAFGTAFEAQKYLTRAEGATLLCQYKNGKD